MSGQDLLAAAAADADESSSFTELMDIASAAAALGPAIASQEHSPAGATGLSAGWILPAGSEPLPAPVPLPMPLQVQNGEQVGQAHTCPPPRRISILRA